jgi:hypothetical protein
VQLSATRNGAAIPPGSIQSVGQDRSALVAVTDIPSAWLEKNLYLRRNDDTKPDQVVRPPRGVSYELPEPQFWKPISVRLELRENTADRVPLATLSFDVVTPWHPKLALATAVLLLMVGAYLTLAFPDVVTAFKGFGGVGFGGVTLSALLIPQLRAWIFVKLHRPILALPSVVAALVAGILVYHFGLITVNLTAETIVCREGDAREGDALAPGQSHASCNFPPGAGYCDLSKEAASCQPMRDATDLPFLVRYGLLRKKEVGCSMKVGPQPQADGLKGVPHVVDAWKKSGLCRPSLLKWQTEDPHQAIQDPPANVKNTTFTASCEPAKNSGECQLPDLDKAFMLRRFRAIAGTTQVELRLTSDGPLREVSVATPASDTPVAIPFPERAVWGQADAEIGRRKVGHSLLRLSPEVNPPPERDECWLLRSDEHLQSLVLRTNTAIARFVASDSSAVSALPMCWSGKLEDVEIYLHENWSPRDGWRLDLPGTMRATRVRIYWADRGYWGEATDTTGATGPRNEIFRIQLHRVKDGESMPKDSLRTLTRGVHRWTSHLAEPEWFWSCSSGSPSETSWSSEKRANVTVKCSASDPPKCTSKNGPVPCWYTLSGRPVSERECGEIVPEKELGKETKAELRTNYVPPGCRPLTFCRELEKGPETSHAARKTNKH